MLTRDDIGKLGWAVEVDGEQCDATNEDGREFRVMSLTPIFTAVAQIAETEGQPFVIGFGGDQEVTPALVKKVSGEKLPDPGPVDYVQEDPMVPASVVVDAATQAAVAAAVALSPGLAKGAKDAVEAASREAAQAAVDDHLAG